MKILLLALGMILAALAARADEASQRITPGMSMSLVGQLLDLNAPICSPAAGSYSVAYRNSIATGCSTRGSDDFATLVFSGASAATYTMPQSKVSTFTGSISGTTLTTPANAVVIGSVITGLGVLDNTYVTAGSGTSWTVNNSQTVGSETLTQSVYPPGHGSCFKSDTAATAPLTITATTSTISGAAGVVNGSPAATGGQIVLFPGGEACLQANTSNNYVVSGFLSGVWFKNLAGLAAAQWTGLSGYPEYDLHCSGVTPTTTGDTLLLQVAYNGTFQTAGYEWVQMFTYYGQAAVGADDSNAPGPATSLALTGGMASPADASNGAGATVLVHLAFADGTGAGFRRSVQSFSSYPYSSNGVSEITTNMFGAAPYNIINESITGIQVFDGVTGSNLRTGLCWLRPSL